MATDPSLRSTTNLAELLSGSLGSTGQILSLVVPFLHLMHLIDDRPDLIATYATQEDQDRVRRAAFMKRQLGFVQKVIIEKVWHDWEKEMDKEEMGLSQVVLTRFIVPPTLSDREEDSAAETESRQIRTDIALSSYSILLSLLSRRSTSSPLHPSTLQFISKSLEQLSASYGVKEVFIGIFFSSNGQEREKSLVIQLNRWETALKLLTSVPAKVANAFGAMSATMGSLNQIPDALNWLRYFETMSTSYEELLWEFAALSEDQQAHHEALSLPLESLLSASFIAYTPSAPSFFPTIFCSLVSRLLPIPFPASFESIQRRLQYIEVWRGVLRELDEGEKQKIVVALLMFLDRTELNQVDSIAGGLGKEQNVQAIAFVLRQFLGVLGVNQNPDSSIWSTILPILLDHQRSWSIGFAEVVIQWIRYPTDDDVDQRATLAALAKETMSIWTSLDGIQKHGDAFRLYLTTLLLLSITSLPLLDPTIVTISRSPAFLNAIGALLSVQKPETRRQGMLVAEIISQRSLPVSGAVSPLSFGDALNGNADGRDSVSLLRRMMKREYKSTDAATEWFKESKHRWTTSTSPHRISPPPARSIAAPISPSTPILPVKRPLISIIDPDDLQPHSLPSPPSESYLSTLASDDPSLYATSLPSTKVTSTRRRGKLRAPVYIPELVAYLKGIEPDGGTEEKSEEQAERVEMGLREGEMLIRRKKGWGGELEENAVNLVIAVIGLQDSFELDNFDQHKLSIMSALVACCPTKVSPTIIEQYFFPNYSTSQRHLMLTSLALGVRELAGLPIPPSTKPNLAGTDLFPSKTLPPALHHRLIAESTSSKTIKSLPSGALDDITAQLTQAALSDAKEEAETTIPEAAREKLLTVRRFASAQSPSSSSQLSRTSPSSIDQNYSSLAAEYFIMPLINRFWLYLRDASTSPTRHRYSSSSSSTTIPLLDPISLIKYLQTLSILLHAARNAPHFLAVLVPEALELVLSLRTAVEETDDVVLASQMELLLVIFDATVAQDGGRTLLGLTNGAQRVAEAREWASGVFEMEERRPGTREGIGRSGRAAAGVLLNLEEILTRWLGVAGY